MDSRHWIRLAAVGLCLGVPTVGATHGDHYLSVPERALAALLHPSNCIDPVMNISTGEPVDALPGEDDFFRKLAQEGRGFFTAGELERIDQAISLYVEATEREATVRRLAEGSAEREELAHEAGLSRARAREALVRALELASATVEVDISSGFPEMDVDHEVQLRGDSGPVLLRVRDQGEGVNFTYKLWDAENVPEVDAWRELEIGPGVTYVLLEVDRAPYDRSSHIFVAHNTDTGNSRTLVLNLEAGPVGQVDFRVTDEHGRVTPAMVRLTHLDSNTVFRPGSAVDFFSQMDAIAGDPIPSPFLPVRAPEAPYPMWLGGPYGGPYWCAAGPFRQSLPAGGYVAHVRRGFEYVPASFEFTVVAGDQATTVAHQLERWTDMSARGWWSGDDHIHSRMTSDSDADRLMVWMEAADVDVGNVLKMGNSLRTFFEQRGFGPGFRVVRGNRALVPGQEDPRHLWGHAIGVNIGWQVRDMDNYLDNAWVAREVNRSGGLYGFAHMIHNGFNVRQDLTMLMPQGLGDFGEVLQSNILDPSLYYDFLDLGFKLTAAAGSDVPYQHALGEVRYYVYTGDTRSLDVDAWFEAMGAGHTFVTNGPMLDVTVDGALPGSALELGDGQGAVRVVARSESPPTAPLAVLKVIANSEVVAEVFPAEIGDGVSVLELEVDVAVEFGAWIAVESRDIHGCGAHTTPVYVTRPGYRHWNPARVPSVLEVCHATLDGMESTLRGFQHQYEGFEPRAGNIFVHRILEQAPAQLERIAAVRVLYDEMEQAFREELARRGAAQE